ncbi:MAG: hypothetical protein LBU89_04575 [Fibromonadaceae bacterium]|jgi:hypothetical protein|nr:hypothetical protein [Fibromonadaceae bacterium]
MANRQLIENGEWRMENNSTNSGSFRTNSGSFCKNSQFSTLNSQLKIPLYILIIIMLVSCATKPGVVFQHPPVNPDAPLAFFGEGNMKKEMRREYAAALQNSGLYNFIFEDFSEEQIKNAVEIRLNYEREKGNLILTAEFVKNDMVWFNFTIKEEKNKKDRQILLNRFVQEVQRITTQPPAPSPTPNCRG